MAVQAKLQRQETETKSAQQTSLELWVYFSRHSVFLSQKFLISRNEMFSLKLVHMCDDRQVVCWWWCLGDRDERLRTMEEELTSQIDELSSVVKLKVAFNDNSEILTCYSALLISAPSLGVIIVNNWLCLDVCLSCCFKLLLLFCLSMESSHFFGHQFSMWHSTKRCFSIFDLGPLMPKIYSPKFAQNRL